VSVRPAVTDRRIGRAVENAGLSTGSWADAPVVWQRGGVVEQRLEGGIANAGKVVRDGRYVLRPSGPHTGSIHALLRAVRHAGFEGAPFPVGIDEDGRERLVFIDGEVPVAPYPDWSQSGTALASIARLLRGLHDAARGFDPRGLTWNDALADPAGGTLVCHDDVEPSNVVFREGIAVALLDFEFAAPGRRVFDLAQLARHWVPIDDDFDQVRLGWRPADRPARLRLVADAYGLDHDGRAELLAAIDDAMARIEAAARHRVDAGDPNAVETLNRTGGIEKYDRRRRWWSHHHDQFAAALI
jgi:Phosphotransferase enzyme family